MAKKKPQVTTASTSGMDLPTEQYIHNTEATAQQAGNYGPGSVLNGAAGYGTSAMGAGNLGFGALSGNPGAVSQLMNPYISGVINANNDQWKNINAQTQNQVNGAATMGNAFGGSRYGVALGTALAHNAQTQSQQTAGLLDQGYGQAMNQAGQLAGYGMQGAGLNTNLGFGGVGNPYQWAMNMAKQGYMGPTSQTMTGQQQQGGGSNPLSGALGGAEIGSMFGPWGAGIGGVAGGLMGLLG